MCFIFRFVFALPVASLFHAIIFHCLRWGAFKYDVLCVCALFKNQRRVDAVRMWLRRRRGWTPALRASLAMALTSFCVDAIWPDYPQPRSVENWLLFLALVIGVYVTALGLFTLIDMALNAESALASQFQAPSANSVQERRIAWATETEEMAWDLSGTPRGGALLRAWWWAVEYATDVASELCHRLGVRVIPCGPLCVYWLSVGKRIHPCGPRCVHR